MRNLRVLYYSLISFWFALTVSTLLWWFYLILNNPSFNHNMILIEGTALISLILCGGLALFFYNFKYIKSKELNQQFLIAFAHDLKTSLSSILLNLENEEMKNTNLNLNTTKTEILRINTLLENSLLHSNYEKISFYNEPIDLNVYFNQLNLNYNIFDFDLFEKKLIFDQRYFDLIVRNILYNSLHHGEATQITVHIKNEKHFTIINFNDNGKTLSTKNNLKNTGLGLKLIDKILSSQHGSVAYHSSGNGFFVQLRFKQ